MIDRALEHSDDGRESGHEVYGFIQPFFLRDIYTVFKHQRLQHFLREVYKPDFLSRLICRDTSRTKMTVRTLSTVDERSQTSG